MNARELAKMLNLHPNTIYTMIKEGKIRAEKIGKSFDIPQGEVNILLANKYGSDLNAESEKAAYTLINEYRSKIEGELHGIMVTVRGMSERFEKMKFDEIHVAEIFPTLRTMYEERQFEYLFNLVTNVKRYETMIKYLDDLAKENEETNSFEKYHSRTRIFGDVDALIKERLKRDET